MSDQPFNPKVTWRPDQFRITGRPMIPAETACDCGCEDIERGPLADLVAYTHPLTPPAAGVAKGFLVVRQGDSAWVQAAEMVLLHDGEGRAAGDIDHTTWRTTRITGD